MKISYQELQSLVQEAINEAYPPILPPDYTDVPEWASRYWARNLWEDKVFVRKSCSFSTEADPDYGLIALTLDESTDDPTVTLGAFTPMKMVARAIDPQLDIQVDLEAAAWETTDDIVEGGKRNSKSDSAVINTAVRQLVTLLGPKDLDSETLAIINKMIAAPIVTKTNKKEAEVKTEAWDGLSGEVLTETFERVVEGQFDKANLIIKGHKVLGVESKNNRRYPVETQKAAVGIFEGAKAYLNHPTAKMMGEARDVRDLIGEHKNVRVEGSATYSDLHLLDNPTVRDYVVPVAESASHLIGSSIVVKAVMKKAESDGVPEAQQIVACRSIDLVAEPATTNGLYESTVSVTTGDETATTKQENTMELKDLTIEMLRKERNDLVELVLADTAKQKESEDLKAKLTLTEDALKATQEKVVALEAKELKLQRETEIGSLVREAKVPDELKYEEKDGVKTIKAHIQGVLERCTTTDERKVFVEQWESMAKGLVKPKGEKPSSTLQTPVVEGFADISPESFVKFQQAIGN